VPIRDYLDSRDGDAASTYYARLSARPVTELPTLADITFSTSELERFLDENLNRDLVARWISRAVDPNGALGSLGASAEPTVDQAFRYLSLDDDMVRDGRTVPSRSGSRNVRERRRRVDG
jgi:hypothetical protein